jgi:hypothetical protein
VNCTDNLEYIRDNINVLKALGKGKVIMIVFSTQKRFLVSNNGSTNIKCEPLTDFEIVETSNVLKEHFGIPATEIYSDKGKEMAISTVIDYFKKL